MKKAERRRMLQRLMLHHDGELDARAAEQLEQRMLWDAAAHEYFADLGRLGDAVRQAAAERVLNDDLADSIMARIAADQPRPTRRLELAWVAPRLGALFVASAALAFGAMLWATNDTPALGVARTGAAVRPSVSAFAPRAIERSAGVAIESIDFGGHSGSIFMVQAGNDTTPVVWLSEPELKEGRSEPL